MARDRPTLVGLRTNWISLIFSIVLFISTSLRLAECNLGEGGDIHTDIVVESWQSPLHIKRDVIIRGGATVIIKPGVELQFSPGVMMAVNGTLLAVGTESERIRFTRTSGYGDEPPEWPSDARLVDERSVLEGRLQLLYRGKWRGVCANSVNWTKADANVTCRQMGFGHGIFYFRSWARNDSTYMLFQTPSCFGSESSVLGCVGAARIQMGSRICLNQQTVHLKCAGLAPGIGDGYWAGLEFYNSSVRTDIEGNTKINESSSRLTHVDVLFAGVSPDGEPVPAVRAQPLAPHLVDVRILYSALDATNFTNVKSSTIVHNSQLAFNRGHGLVVETNYGRVSVTDSRIHSNVGNGIKAKFLDGRWPFFVKDRTFCYLPNLGSQQFPVIMVGIPTEITDFCERIFITALDQVLTLVVLEMDIVDEAEGKLEVWDGRHSLTRKLGTYTIKNGTLPQGITSTYNSIRIKFSWTRPPQWPNCHLLRECVKFTIMVDSGPATVPELFMNNTEVSNNTQHGAYLENVRNYAFISHSKLNHNQYGAGLRVYGGAGDIHVNYSHIDYNQDNGVNITYDGGYRIFNLSSFSNNYGNGINVTFNETSVDNKTRFAKHQRTEVFRSTVVGNDGWGVRVGNYCRAGSAVINDTEFAYNRRDAIELESCYRMLADDADVTNFTVGYNTFRANYGHGVKIKPLVNAVGRIGNNTFFEHPRHTLLIDNGEDFLENRYYSNLKVDYVITSNRFYMNQGFYVVNLRLSEGSMRQKMIFMYNKLENNLIQGSSPDLNERSRNYAVVILSSTNIKVSRNHLENLDSRYELTTHLLSNQAIEATEQWWGTIDYRKIIERIFDRFNRYNLGEIRYHPVLSGDKLYTDKPINDDSPIEVDFNRGNRLGGRLDVSFTTDERIDHYIVDRDINILPNGRLTVRPGTTLAFENSLGMLVQGALDVQGTPDRPILINMANMTAVVNHTHVRLVDGADELSGRLEVRPSEEDEWGTVCNKGWTIGDASVVCKMLGHVVHPDLWLIPTEVEGAPEQPIWRSQVKCTDLDMDITMCEADGRLDHTCNHTQDVSVRCVAATWGGIHFRASARHSVLRYVNVTAAGLMDPTIVSYSPAIQIDYNIHSLESMVVSGCMANGIDILHNDVYANAKLAKSYVVNNLGSGVTTHGPFFEVHFSEISDNSDIGFIYNPTYTAQQAQFLRQGIHNPTYLHAGLGAKMIPNEGYLFFATEQDTTPTLQVYDTEIYVEQRYRVVVDVLDYNPDTSEEKVEIFDGGKRYIRPETARWAIEDDLVDFPIVSTSTNITIRIHVKGPVSGRLTFSIRSKPFDWRWPWPDVKVKNSTMLNNRVGIETRHYNQPSNEYLDLFFRYRWQTVELYGVEIRGSREEALRVPSITKYHELYMPSFEELAQTPFRVAEITYNIDACLFTENGGGVLGEHNHVEFSNNIWIWEVTNNRFEANRAGGFNILLPKVNLMYQELFNHSVHVNDTVFEGNAMFEFRVDGFYCNSSISRNTFRRNRCRMGCVTFAGTEKDLDVDDNELTDNVGVYVLEFNMNSHTPYTRWVEAHMTMNILKRNRKPAVLLSHPGSSPTSYTVGIKGVQNVTVNRNFFGNSLDYELVGGQASSLLQNYLDVTENWWGTTNQSAIQQLIFDFDDWNSYAIAEYYPYLTYDGPDAPTATEEKLKQGVDKSGPLGGRVEGAMTLDKKSSPYIIKRDLTVMPLGSLFIDPGVELQFYPNVGILVLGSLTASGKPDQRIKMGPIPVDKIDRRSRRQAPPVHGGLRLQGGNSPDEGFIEIYNATERRWTIVCDNHFNDKTGEVACRSMGRESSNVIVRRSRYYDHFVRGYPLMHEQRVEWFWRRTLLCDGREPDFEHCRYKINYNLLHCMEAREYVFLRCGPRRLAAKYEYWGNLRFSTPEFEQGNIRPGFSILQHVDMYGGGLLHEERAAAIESVYRVPSTDRVRITHCAWNGYDFIAPKDEFRVAFNTIENNNGYGIGGVVLNGETRYEVERSSFQPLEKSHVPYNVFGLVRMCTAEKLVLVRDRLLLYHKYDFDTIDCVKIIRSKEPQKRIAVRFLQLNLYNDTFYKNSVQMYNGEFFDVESLLGEVTANSTERERAIKYETRDRMDVMGVRVTASPASGEHGFVAEVVTLPLSPDWRPDLGPGLRQQILRTTLSGNSRGAFRFSNVGVLNPAVQIEMCNIQECGHKLLNLTSPPVIDLYVQNSKLVTIANNYIAHNGGGITVETNGVATNLYANITNNVIVHNTHGSNIEISGKNNHGFFVRANYIANNNVEYHNNLAMFGIRLNFTNNIVQKNFGRTTLNATVDRQVSVSQNYKTNAFFDNRAIGANKTTIFVGSAKHLFRDNYFFNWWNIFELVTYNRTRRELTSNPSSYPDQDEPEVDCANNWWGSPNPAFVRGRIWDRYDDDNLIRVKYQPFYTSNSSVMQGRCHPGWRLYDTRCYLYMGGVLPYHEARRQCKLAGGGLAWKRDRESERFLGEMVAMSQENYDQYWVAWVYDDWRQQDTCTAVINYKVEHVACHELHPFVCEKDPYVQPKMNWWPIGIAIGVVGLLLIVLIIIITLAILKSRKRVDQRLERRNSLRQSVRSSKQSVYANQHASLSRAGTDASLISNSSERLSQKRRRPQLGPSRAAKGAVIDLAGVTLYDTSTDSIDKEKMYGVRPSTPASLYDGPGASAYSSSSSKPDLSSSSYLDSDLRDHFPNRLENEISHIAARPMYGHVMRNDGFDDERSIDRSRFNSYSSAMTAPGGAGNGNARRYPRPNYSTSSDQALDERPRPRPKETAM